LELLQSILKQDNKNILEIQDGYVKILKKVHITSNRNGTIFRGLKLDNMNNVTQMAFEGLAKFTDIVKEQLIEHIMCESERCVEEAAGSGGEKVDG